MLPLCSEEIYNKQHAEKAFWTERVIFRHSIPDHKKAVDIVGDYLLAKGFHGGMFGMALATSASYGKAALVYLMHFRGKRNFSLFSSGIVTQRDS